MRDRAMDFLYFKKLYEPKRDKDFSMRSFILALYRRVLDGTYYDILPEAYNARSSSSVNILEPDKFTFQTSGMSQRRPSVRSSLCSVVVDESISFLFDDEHFPRITSDDEVLALFLAKIVDESFLQDAMMSVAYDGSVGSGALLVRLSQGKYYYESLLTEYCTPYFNPEAPDELIGLCEQYKVYGNELIAKGYTEDGIEPEKIYWFRRDFTPTEEIVYKPTLAKDAILPTTVDWQAMVYKSFSDGTKTYNQNGKEIVSSRKVSILERDELRSCNHNIGFVPIVWVKNLPGNIHGVQGNAIDGACTFAKAIDTTTELEYQLSQCGRGLKYSAEPILFINDPNYGITGTIDKSKGGVIVGDENSDAKMIEINGDGCRAALEYSEQLRQIALENIHGNRSSPKKTTFGISGKSMQMFDHPLILLAGKLRISYGQRMLRHVLRVIAKMATKNPVILDGNIFDKKFNENASIKLIWSQWFPESAEEIQTKTNTAIAAKDAGLITTETAAASIANSFGINNVDKEVEEATTEQNQFLTDNTPKLVENIKA